jgi:hypothetical protein
MLSPHAITMSSSKNKKDKDRKPSRKDLAAEVEDLRAKLDKRKGQVRKLNKRLDALSLELRKSLLALGKHRTAPAHPPANPAPHLSPLPAPPRAPPTSQVAITAYHAHLDRVRDGRSENPEADWFRAESLLWKNIALNTHAEAVRLIQETAQNASPAKKSHPADPPADISPVAKEASS